jgi:protein SCO1
MQLASSRLSTSRWRRLLLLLALVVATLLVLGLVRTFAGGSVPAFHATAYEPPAPAADFALDDHAGSRTTLSGLRGVPVFLFFGYTHCPDVCPLTLTRLRAALDAAGPAAAEARVLLITVDPARDTPEVLSTYVARFGPQVIGLTGSPEELKAVQAAYGVHSAPEHSDPSLLGHTSAVFGIDRQGRIRVLLHPDVPAAELDADVATLLRL